MMRPLFLALLSASLLGCAAARSPGQSAATATAPALAPAPSAAAAQVKQGLRQVRDVQLFVREVGPAQAPTLVVIHGGPGGNYTSLRALEALSPSYRVVFYDQRGTGESERLPVSLQEPGTLARLSLAQNVEDLEALRKLLGQDKIALIGHSWGGALAVFYAAAYPQRVDKLIVYSGGPETVELAQRKRAAHQSRLSAEEKTLLQRRSQELGAAVQGGAPQEELDRRFVELAQIMFPSLYCQRPAQATAEQGRGGFWANFALGKYVEDFSYSALEEGLGKLKAPTLLSWGRCEPSPRERLTNLLERIPQARFVTFAKSGHNALEEEPELFWATLRAFLAGRPLPLEAYSSSAELPAIP